MQGNLTETKAAAIQRKTIVLASHDLVLYKLNRFKLKPFSFQDHEIESLKISGRTEPTRRNAEDICNIVQALRAFGLFSGHEEKLILKEKVFIALSCYLQEYQPMGVVCRIREASNHVYFVLEGEVAVTLANPKVIKPEDLQGTIITTYKQGTSFGELGIISNTTRTANCIATQPTVLLALTKQAFKASIADKMISEKRSNFAFVSAVTIFEDWHHQSIFGILTHIKVRNCIMGESIYRVGDTDTNIYIVYQGEVQIYINKLKPEEKIDPESYKNFTKKSPPQSFEFKSLLRLGEGSYFGDEEGFNDPIKQFQAKVTSVNCQLFIIAKDKIKMNGQQYNDFALVEEIYKKGDAKLLRMREKVKNLQKINHDQQKEMEALQERKAREAQLLAKELAEKEEKPIIIEKEADISNTGSSTQTQIHQLSGKKTSDAAELHSKMADRVEQLIKFKESLIAKRSQTEDGSSSIASKFIDFTTATNGRNLPGRLTLAKQIEIAIRPDIRSTKIQAFRSQGKRFKERVEMPESSVINYNKLNDRAIRALTTCKEFRKNHIIFLTEDPHSHRHRKAYSLNASVEDPLSNSINIKNNKRSQISRVLSASRAKSYEQYHGCSDPIDQPSSVIKNRVLRIDRASRALAQRHGLGGTNLQSQFSSAEKQLTNANTTQATTFYKSGSPTIRLPSTHRTSILRDGNSRWLTTEKWRAQTQNSFDENVT